VARTQRERDAERREVKLAEIKEQVEDGQLSIRQMTPEERARYGSDDRPEPPPNAKRRRRSGS
jgi:hypothetical protein